MSTTTTAPLGDLLQHSTYAARLNKQQTAAEASIEIQLATNNTSIELPEEIKGLITGSDYWVKAKTNRYLMLIRQGYKELLLTLAHEAQTKHSPANWFATACSKANWQRTLDYAKKQAEVVKQAAETAKKLGTSVTKFIYKQLWRGVNTIRWAALAAETAHDKPNQDTTRHFMWLCGRDTVAATYGN